MKKSNSIIIPAKLDETSTVIAQLHNVSDRYVRKLINEGYMPKSKVAKQKALNIIKSYNSYKNKKTALVKSVEKLIKVA